MTQVLQGALPAGGMSVEPVLSYPSVMEPGNDYLFSVDLRPVGGAAGWPAGAGEEYAVHCLVNGAPLFRSEPVGEGAVVVHRFGGTYGPAQFLLRPTRTAGEGVIRVTLVNAWGVPLATLETPAIPVRPGGLFALSQPPAAPSRVAGMGAILHPEGGVVFRVWAPNAEEVFVAGDFNDWSADATPLAREEDGCWSAHVTQAGAGQAYKYLVQGPGHAERFERSDPYAREISTSDSSCVIHDPDDFDWGDAAYSPPAWNEAVIYEMHVGTFNDEAGGGTGTFDTVAARLDYLRELGINCILLLPVMEFPGDHGLGFNPSHPFAVEYAYGGPSALKRLVRAAHERGIAVMPTVDYSHFGPQDLDLWRFDGWGEKGRGGIYFYNDFRANTPWGATRPDYGRPEVRRYILDNALMWLDEFRMDGLHWSATGYVRSVNGRVHDHADELREGRTLLQHANAEVQARFPGRLRSAEEMAQDPWLTGPLESGGGGFITQWDAGFVHPVREALVAVEDHDRDMQRVARAIAGTPEHGPFSRVVYTESHDEVANGRARVPHEIAPEQPDSWASRKRSTLGAALVLTAPGIPMLFQGQEILEDEWFRDSDPVDWSRLERFPGIHTLYRDMIRLRRNASGRTRGLQGQHVQVHHVNGADQVVAFHRWAQGGPGDDVVVVANFGNEAYDEYLVGFPRPGLWKVRLNSDWQGYSPDYEHHASNDKHADGPARDGMPCSAAVSIGAYTVVILSQEPEQAPRPGLELQPSNYLVS